MRPEKLWRLVSFHWLFGAAVFSTAFLFLGGWLSYTAHHLWSASALTPLDVQVFRRVLATILVACSFCCGVCAATLLQDAWKSFQQHYEQMLRDDLARK